MSSTLDPIEAAARRVSAHVDAKASPVVEVEDPDDDEDDTPVMSTSPRHRDRGRARQQDTTYEPWDDDYQSTDNWEAW